MKSFHLNYPFLASLFQTLVCSHSSLKMGQPRPLFHLFLVFINKQYNFYYKSMWKNVMSIQYTAPGFEPTSFGTWVSSPAPCAFESCHRQFKPPFRPIRRRSRSSNIWKELSETNDLKSVERKCFLILHQVHQEQNVRRRR